MKMILLTLLFFTQLVASNDKFITESSLQGAFQEENDLKWVKKYLSQEQDTTKKPWKSPPNTCQRAQDVLDWFETEDSRSQRLGDAEQGRLESMLYHLRKKISDDYDYINNKNDNLKKDAELFKDLLPSIFPSIKDLNNCPAESLKKLVETGLDNESTKAIPKIAKMIKKLEASNYTSELARMFSPECNQISRYLFQLSEFHELDEKNKNTNKKCKEKIIDLSAPPLQNGGGCLTPEQLAKAKQYLQGMKSINIVTANGGPNSNGAGHVGDSSNGLQTLLSLGFNGKIEVIHNAEAPQQMRGFFEKFGFPAGCPKERCGADISFSKAGNEEVISLDGLRKKNIPGYKINQIQMQEEEISSQKKRTTLLDNKYFDLTLFAGIDSAIDKDDPDNNHYKYRDFIPNDPIAMAKSKNIITVNEMHWIEGSSSKYEGKCTYYAASKSDTGLYMNESNKDRKNIILIRNNKNEEEKNQQTKNFVNNIPVSTWGDLPESSVNKIKNLLEDSIVGKINMGTVYGLHNAVGRYKDQIVSRYANACQQQNSNIPTKIVIVAPNDETVQTLKDNQKLSRHIVDLRQGNIADSNASTPSPEIIILPRLPKPVYELLVRATNMPVMVEGTGSAAEAAADAIPHINIGNVGGTELYVSEKEKKFRNTLSDLISHGRTQQRD